MSNQGPPKKSDTESVKSVPETPINERTTETADAEEETLALTVTEGRLLRRLALQMKSRCDYVWANKATIGRLPMLVELTRIKEAAEIFYAVLTDATWRELFNPNQRNV